MADLERRQEEEDPDEEEDVDDTVSAGFAFTIPMLTQ